MSKVATFSYWCNVGVRGSNFNGASPDVELFSPPCLDLLLTYAVVLLQQQCSRSYDVV